MAIQRIVDQDGIPPMDGGKRVPLGISLAPAHDFAPQHVTVGAT
jgi:hypothetical protein